MAKPVIVTHTAGQTDVVEDGQNGLYVPPGDPPALRRAIQYLLNRPDERRRLGTAGRRLVEDLASLEHYVLRLRLLVDESIGEAPRRSTAPGRLEAAGVSRSGKAASTRA